VPPRCVNDLVKPRRETGFLTPRQQGNGGGHGKLAGVTGWLKARVTAKGEITLDERVAGLAQNPASPATVPSVRRVLRGRGPTRRKSPAGP
jgi:hypothetical protein